MEDDLLDPTPSEERDGSMRRALDEALVRIAHAQAGRVLLSYVIVAITALVWVVAVWAGAPTDLRRLAVGGWLLCALGLGATVVSEVRWRRTRETLLAKLRVEKREPR